MPNSPLSSSELTGIVPNGAGSRVPSLIILRLPSFSETNNRPSGANSMAVGVFRPLAYTVSVNPAGSALAGAAAGEKTDNDRIAATTIASIGLIIFLLSSSVFY